MEYGGPALEHGSSSIGRWLRAHRVRIAFWIAVAEGILVVFHAVAWWAAILLAVVVLVAWFSSAHRLQSDTARQAGWIAAASQALVTLLAVFVLVIGTLALIFVGILAAVALIFLFSSHE
jgi:hypothetical protein